jgi:gamma-F420-2:alpha-L-glutamate ligase
MGRKFGLPVRHSERWEKAIDKAARAMFGAVKPPSVDELAEEMPLVAVPARVRKRTRKPTRATPG